MRHIFLLTVLLLVTGLLTACDNNQQTNQTDETTQTSTDTSAPENTTTNETSETAENSESSTTTESTEPESTTTDETPESAENSESATTTESTDNTETSVGNVGDNANTLVVGRISQPESLDPAWNFDTASNEVLKHIYMGLFEFEGSSVDSFVPAIATEIPTVENGGISEDAKTYRIKIRDGLKFASGNPITAEDVEYSIERSMLIDRSGGPAFLFNDVLVFGEAFSSTRDAEGTLVAEVRGMSLAEAIDKSVEVDGDTVVFNLLKPFPPFLQVLTSGVAAVTEKAKVVEAGGWAGFSDDPEADMAAIAEFNNPELGNETLFEMGAESGPFKLVSWDRTSGEVLLSRNEHWVVPSTEWEAIYGQPGIENILYREVFENATRELGLQQGELDVVDISPAARLDEIKNADGIRVIDQIPGLTFDAVNFNYNFQDSIDNGTAVGVGSGLLDGGGVPGNFFQDDFVRKGFSHAFDQETLIKDVLNGRSTRPATPVHAGLPFHDAEIEGIRFDLVQAEEALKQAFGGELWETGFSMDCIHNDGNVRRQTSCEVLANNLSLVNPKFVINVAATPFSVFLGQIIDGTMPLYVLGWAPDFVDAGNFIDQWMTSGGQYSGFNEITQLDEFNTPGNVDLPSGESFEYANWDELLRRAFEEPNAQDRQALYTKAQQLFVDHSVAIAASNPTAFEVTRDWVGGLVYNGSLSFSVHYGTHKEEGAPPNCLEIQRVNSVTLDGSC